MSEGNAKRSSTSGLQVDSACLQQPPVSSGLFLPWPMCKSLPAVSPALNVFSPSFIPEISPTHTTVCAYNLCPRRIGRHVYVHHLHTGASVPKSRATDVLGEPFTKLPCGPSSMPLRSPELPALGCPLYGSQGPFCWGGAGFWACA